MIIRILSITSVLLFAAAQLTQAAGPRVDIVIGEKAPALEKRAAEDVAADLKNVYDAEVKIATAAPEDAENVIFVGSPETNEQTKKQIEENWPKLSEQGHVLRTIKYRNKPALFIGGGSPIAAYWGAAEYAHTLGIRTMLYGDLHPVLPPTFSLDNYEVIQEPIVKERGTSHVLDQNPTGRSSWGLEDQKRLLRQLARLKRNRLSIAVRSTGPFVHFEFEGVRKKTAVLFYGREFSVSGDTAGRAAFKGAKLFENPDIVSKGTYEERLKAGQNLIRGLIEEAHSLGMGVDLEFNPLEFPKEFEGVFPDSRPVAEPIELAVEPDPNKNVPNEKLIKLAITQLKAYQNTFSKADSIALSTFQFPEIVTRLKNDEIPLDRRSFRNEIPFVALTPISLVIDANLNAYQSSRWSFDLTVTREAACRALVEPICGAEVDGVVLKANRQMDEAVRLISDNDLHLTLPGPNMILKHYANTDPPPEWWSKVRDNYLGAMNDMYRANSRAREGGRSYTLYLARRCEFGYEYMNCVEATRLAGVAKGKKDSAEQRAQLEKAIESMNSACSALAAVARDQSDRGMIAVCNEFGYKALQKELEKLDAEEGI
ncbi:MAG: alpha-glucuronidase family glycosyl hydrolase [Pirellulaceae bacterium]